MTKTEFSQRLGHQMGVDRETARRFITAFTNMIVDELVDGRPVTIAQLGTLRPYTRPAREYANLATGCKQPYPARIKVKFKESSKLLPKLNP